MARIKNLDDGIVREPEAAGAEIERKDPSGKEAGQAPASPKTKPLGCFLNTSSATPTNGTLRTDEAVLISRGSSGSSRSRSAGQHE